jgi:hypothetical protein
VITLGGRSFTGPFMLPLWSVHETAGLYAIMVPGWRLLTFRALHIGQSGSLSGAALKREAGYAGWVSAAGTEWNLYVAVHEMSFSTETQRQAALLAVLGGYRPSQGARAPHSELPGLKTMLLARALRGEAGE